MLKMDFDKNHEKNKKIILNKQEIEMIWNELSEAKDIDYLLSRCCRIRRILTF
jgi:hypothetical protein